MSKSDEAIATPTKRFFVSMLTRDINLADAILDLIDNCLDGALRTFDGKACDDYTPFTVSLKIIDKQFSIQDNCGGIPREVANKYAFRFGREIGDDRDADEETIGMYGVGMKRALFKMGLDSLVSTRYKDDSYQVAIPASWLTSKDWSSLPIESHQGSDILDYQGTKITVENLHAFVVREFETESFLDDLRKSISEHFTYFLQRGLTVNLNGIAINPAYVEVLTSENTSTPASPYVYEETVDGVLIRVVVGVNSRIRKDEDEDEKGHSAKSTSGWSVFCNNRAVVVGDYSRLTWNPKLPRYHDQYNIITGIVEFKSTDANKLPVSTTKRDLDANSDLWWAAQEKMYEGMRMFIDYTNSWKNHDAESRSKAWEDAEPMSAENAVKAVSKRVEKSADSDLVYFNPRKNDAFPEPPQARQSSRRITFSRPLGEVKTLSEWFFDIEDEKPSRIGEECWIQALAIIEKNEGGSK